jgi:hypothetical protein
LIICLHYLLIWNFFDWLFFLRNGF